MIAPRSKKFAIYFYFCDADSVLAKLLSDRMSQNENPEKYSFCSSVAADAWVDMGGRHSFQSWHFDGVSDDGEEALVVDFYDNFILSPRFHLMTEKVPVSALTWPAVCVAYYAHGRQVLHATSEFPVSAFAVQEQPGCSIGRSAFSLKGTEYGSGLFVTLDLPAFAGRRIRGEIEWLSVEADLEEPSDATADAVWNMTMPRADVSGRLELVGRTGSIKQTFHFRGTGYHDHIKSRDVHYRDLSSRMWGRAHFTDATLVFERHGGVQDHSAPGRFILIRNGEMTIHEAACLASEHKRDKWGLNFPRRISYMSEEGIRVRVRPRSVVTSGISDVKTLGDITLDLGDGKSRKATGITEFVDPRRLGKRLNRLITDLKTGRGDRSGWL